MQMFKIIFCAYYAYSCYMMSHYYDFDLAIVVCALHFPRRIVVKKEKALSYPFSLSCLFPSYYEHGTA